MNSNIDRGFAKYSDLIDNSRFRERIRALEQNPNSAFAYLHRRSLMDVIKPCCWGTAVYVVGGNSRMKRLWAESGKRLDDYSDACGDFVCIPDENSPGYVGEEPMKLFLKTCEFTESDKDTVISFNWREDHTELCRYRLRHSGVALGKKDGITVMFHQVWGGGRFAVCSLEEFASTLRETTRRTLRHYFYQPQN